MGVSSIQKSLLESENIRTYRQRLERSDKTILRMILLNTN